MLDASDVVGIDADLNSGDLYVISESVAINEVGAVVSTVTAGAPAVSDDPTVCPILIVPDTTIFVAIADVDIPPKIPPQWLEIVVLVAEDPEAEDPDIYETQIVVVSVSRQTRANPTRNT